MNVQSPTPNVRRPNHQRGRWLAAMGLALGNVIGSLAQPAASPTPGVTGSTGSLTRYYPAPNFRQMEFRLTGDAIRQQPDNKKQYRATNPQFISFRENGETILTITTPECLLDETDPARRTVSSTEELLMRTGDGQSSIRGRGFQWRQNERILIISNDVRALIQWTNNAPPLEITSRWFEFDTERRRGIFHDAVRGENPDMIFTCAMLAVSGSATKARTNSLDMIEATGGLEVTRKVGIGFAKAERGTFRDADKRLELIGDAEWKFDANSGRADRMVVWTNEMNLEAIGNVVMSGPRASLGAAGELLRLTNAPVHGGPAGLIKMEMEHFSRRGERLLAEGKVRIGDGTNLLSCDRLEGKQGTPKSPEAYATATGNVFAGRSDGGIHSDRADYSKADNEVVFTGNPRFVQGEVHGTAGRVIAKTLTSEVLADNGVAVTFPLQSDSGSLMDFLPNQRTNRVATPKQADQRAGVTAQRFWLRDRMALFAGEVEAHQLPADGSEPRLSCDELEIRLAPDKKRAESLQARQNVICERGLVGVTNGPTELIYTRLDCETLTAHANPTNGDLIDLVAAGGVQLDRAGLTARGDRAIYTQADQLLKLLGNSVVDSPEAVYTSSEGLTYNVATEEVTGKFDSIRAKPGALKRVEELPTLPPNE